jgi:dTDP-glucose 4,6-dehydratase
MAVWLLVALAHGESGRAYNVGSERAVTIAELAAITASRFTGGREVVVEGGVGTASRYVPSTRRARAELGLEETVSLEEAVGRTIGWHLAGGLA